MSIEINGYNSNVNKYYDISKVNNTKEEAKPENVNTASKKDADTAVVYEKSANVSSNKATYEINKKSSTDRAAIVEQMKKAEADNRQSLINMVREMMNTQAGKQKTADGFSAFGGTVTEEARRKAQESFGNKPFKRKTRGRDKRSSREDQFRQYFQRPFYRQTEDPDG